MKTERIQNIFVCDKNLHARKIVYKTIKKYLKYTNIYIYIYIYIYIHIGSLCIDLSVLQCSIHRSRALYMLR